jgi:ankyrin repeat protein
MSSFTGETKSSSMSEKFTMPTFYEYVLPPSTNLPNECFTDSVDITIKGIERNRYNHPMGNENTRAACLHELCKSYRLGMCQDCRAELSPERVATEEQEAKRVKDEDLLSVGKEISEDNVDHVNERREARAANAECILDPAREMHAERLMGLGIRISALIAFAYAHNCWDWTTANVVRDIIKPVTREHDRCRYGDIPDLKACFGRATVFMSHCWGATFGDLIGAACHGARTDRIVWIDIFAVRQWPGNVADLDFRGVLGKCGALVVSTSPVDELKEWVYGADKMAFLASDEFKTAKKTLPFFRLWCIVELTAAIILNVPIVVKGGSVTSEASAYAYGLKYKSWTKNNDGKYNVEDGYGYTRDNVPTTEITIKEAGIYEYTKCTGELMFNLQSMIDVEASECAVQADYDREMAVVRSLEGGSKVVNALVAGVLNGASLSMARNILEIDAFVCKEPESLRALNIPLGCEREERELAKVILKAACAGGRESVVNELLLKWSVKEDDNQDKEGETKRNDSMKKEKEKKREWLIQLIDDSQVLLNALTGGHVGVVEMLLEVAGIDVNGDKYKNNGVVMVTPLYKAICNGHTEVVRALLAAKDINLNKKYGAINGICTPLDIATTNNHTEVTQLLKDAGAQYSLCYASKNGHNEAVEALLAAEDIDVNKGDGGGGTPLFGASENGHTKVVKALLAAKDIHVNEEYRGLRYHGDTPLDIATKNNHKEIIQLLIDAGAQCSLHQASKTGNVELVQALLAAKDINVNGASNGYTPLFLASMNGHTKVVKVLLAAKEINVNQENYDGETPLYEASRNGHTEVVKVLLAAKDINVNCNALYIASQNGHTKLVKALLAVKDINLNNARHGYTPLDMATEYNHTEIIQLLIDAGAQCSLYQASKNGHTEVVKELLAAKDIDVNQAFRGDTPLSVASYKGHTKVVKALLAAKNIDVNRASKYKGTPLDRATRNNHTEIIQLLKDAGAK